MQQPNDIQQEPAEVADAQVDDSPVIDALGICLSGGGYRAALYHLGALRCLHELQILQKVKTVSSVSGGSILSAYVAKRMFELGAKNQIQFDDWERDVSAGFRSFVKNDIRTLPVLLTVLWNWLSPQR